MAAMAQLNQILFDTCVKQCFDQLRDSDFNLAENVTTMLQVLMSSTIEADYPGNNLKAHLLIIVNSLISLRDMGLEGSYDHIADLDRTEVLYKLDIIQSSLENLWPESASTLKDISRECLFQVYVLIVSIISHNMAGEAPELEDLTLLERVLNRMKSVTNFKSGTEKNIFSKCERVLSRPGSHLDFPQPSDLWPLIRKVVLEASKLIEAPNECVCQLQHNQLHRGTARERRCKPSDLLEIVGKTPEEYPNATVFAALREKCERIKRERQQSRNQERLNISTESNLVPKGSPRQKAAALNQGKVSTTTLDVPPSPGSRTESRLGSEDTRQGYPKLPSVKPRLSLLNFGESKKAPSHTIIAGGKWQKDEEERFILKTLEIGEGKWMEIKDALRSLRSCMQLKDKWRQIPLSRVRKVARNHGKVYRGNKKN